MDLIGLVYLVIQLQFLYAGLYHIAAVRCIIYGKCLGEPNQFRLIPEEPYEDGVECAHYKSARLVIPYKRSYSLLHLPGCLVGESEGKYTAWGVSLVQNVRNPAGKHFRFSAPRSGNDQLRPLNITNCLILRRIQSFKNLWVNLFHNDANLLAKKRKTKLKILIY